MKSTETIVLGGGCFWCLDALYQQINGVIRVTTGYAGGKSENPTYQDHGHGAEAHAEVVEIEFSPDIIPLETILKVFWHIHDPTTPNRQGVDIGPQYRSIILHLIDQQPAVEASLKFANDQLWDGKIVTEISQLDQFYRAEEEQQDFFLKYPASGYCQVMINPKLAKFNKNFPDLLKKAS